MVTVYDADPNKLIEKVAEKLKASKVEKPEFIGLVKSGSHTQRPPDSGDFWYVRCASILRQIYVNSKTGTVRLRKHYGGKKSRGVKPEIHVPAGGSTIRKAMQNLEKAGYLSKGDKDKGRILTAKGRQLLDNAAKEVSG